jgi:phenylacetate-CoA ligase
MIERWPMPDQITRLRSGTPGMAFPPLLAGLPAELLALQHTLERTQWWSAEQLRAQQFRQLDVLLQQAATIPFHAARLNAAGWRKGQPITPAIWSRLPPLTRADLQREGEDLHAPTPPQEHGAVAQAATGGSTGQPVRVRRTALEALLWNGLQLREELWHREDPGGHIARVRTVPAHLSPEQAAQVRSPDGLTLPDWGPPIALVWSTGRLTLIDSTRDVGEQVSALQRLDPDYLFTQPSNLRLILAECRAQGTRFSRLRAVWTLSEGVEDDLRDACRDVLGVPIVHNYSCAEVGYLVLQCPQQERHFHICAETVLLEVVDAQGRACAPGEIGRVLVTGLHNFAMPLLRYELGDEAEVGGRCACGRGLPVLRRVVGRTMDRLRLHGGGERRVELRHYTLAKDPRILEYQVVQRSLQLVEILLVLRAPLDPGAETALLALARQGLGEDFEIRLRSVEAIPRTPAGKLRPFISDVT